MERNKMNIEYFKARKKEKGLTNYRISKMTGISQAALSDLENEKYTDLRVSNLIKLADVLDASLDDLAGRKKNHSK